MEKETVKRADTVLQASLGANHKRRLVRYASERGLSLAEALRRMIDREIPATPEPSEPQG